MRSHLFSLFHEDYPRQENYISTNFGGGGSSPTLNLAGLPWETNARKNSNDGLLLRPLRRAWPFRAVRHLHVHVAGGQLVEHLVETASSGFVAFGADGPSDVVVLLIGGTLRV